MSDDEEGEAEDPSEAPITKRVEEAASDGSGFGIIAAIAFIVLVIVFGLGGNGGAPGV